MIAAFSRLPTLVTLIVMLLVSNGIAFAILTLSRRFGRKYHIVGVPAVGAFATACGALCSLLFSFTIVTLWNADTRAESNVDAEAQAIQSIARDMRHDQLPLVHAYLAASIAEWPSLCGGGDFSRSDDALDTLQNQAAPRDAAHDDDLFRQFTALDNLRGQRLRASESGAPPELWTALVVLPLALFVVLAFTFLENTTYQAALMITFAAAIGVVFWVATLLDFPFCGGTSVSPQPLLDALRVIG